MYATFNAINPAETIKLQFDISETPSNAFANYSSFQINLNVFTKNISLSSKKLTFDWELCLGDEARLERDDDSVIHIESMGRFPADAEIGKLYQTDDTGIYWVYEGAGSWNKAYSDTECKFGESGKTLTLSASKKTDWSKATVSKLTQPIELRDGATSHSFINRHLSGRGAYVLKVSVPEWLWSYGVEYEAEFELDCEPLDRLTRVPDTFNPVITQTNSFVPSPITSNFTHKLILTAESEPSEALKSNTFWDEDSGEYKSYGYYDYPTPLIVNGVSGSTMAESYAESTSYKVTIEFTPTDESSITTKSVFSVGSVDTAWEYKYRGELVCTIDATIGSNILTVTESDGYTVNGVTIVRIIKRSTSQSADEENGAITITPYSDFANTTVSKSTFKATARLNTYETEIYVIRDGHFNKRNDSSYTSFGDYFIEPLRLGVLYTVTCRLNNRIQGSTTFRCSPDVQSIEIAGMTLYLWCGMTQLQRAADSPSDYTFSIWRMVNPSLSSYVGYSESKIDVSIPNSELFYPSTPSVSINDGTAAKGIVGEYVQNKSTLAVNIGNGSLTPSIPKCGATISKYTTRFLDSTGTELQAKNGQSVTSGTFSVPTVNVEVTVTDSRGLSNRFIAATESLVLYSTPEITLIDVHRCDAEGNLDDNGIYLAYELEFSIHDFGAGVTTNYGEITVRAKRRTESSFTVQDTVSNIHPTTKHFAKIILPYSGAGLNTGYNYNIRLYLADLLASTYADGDIPSADVIIDVNSNGTGIGIGKVSEHIEYDTVTEENGEQTTTHYDNGVFPLEIAWGTDIQNTLRLSGVSNAGDKYIEFYGKDGLVHAKLQASDDGENLELLVYQNGRISDDDPHTKFLPNGRIEPISTQIDSLQTNKQDKMGSTTITLLSQAEDGSAAWVDYNQEVLVDGITATCVVQVAPAPSDIEDYLNFGIVCIRQDDGKLVFQCDSVPNLNIAVNIVYWEDTH